MDISLIANMPILTSPKTDHFLVSQFGSLQQKKLVNAIKDTQN